LYVPSRVKKIFFYRIKWRSYGNSIEFPFFDKNTCDVHRISYTFWSGTKLEQKNQKFLLSTCQKLEKYVGFFQNIYFY